MAGQSRPNGPAEARQGAFDGVGILALAEQYRGPYARLLMADLCFDVPLVERPGSGDFARAYPAIFASLARNRCSTAIELERCRLRALPVPRTRRGHRDQRFPPRHRRAAGYQPSTAPANQRYHHHVAAQPLGAEIRRPWHRLVATALSGGRVARRAFFRARGMSGVSRPAVGRT